MLDIHYSIAISLNPNNQLVYMNLAKTILLTLASLVLTIGLLEVLAVPMLLKPSDMPYLAEISAGDVLHYSPNQKGVWRVKNEIETPFNINAQGWNSVHQDYKPLPVGETLRVAIIGDSYVEALQVTPQQNFAQIIERQVDQSVVYSFGLSGAHLAQYLYMYRELTKTYDFDLVIFLVIRNDFEESITHVQNAIYSKSYFTWSELDGGQLVGKLPDSYQRTWKDWVKRSNLFRYLVVRQRVNITNLRNGIETRFGFRPQESQGLQIEIDPTRIKRVIARFLTEVEQLAAQKEDKVFVVLNGSTEMVFKRDDGVVKCQEPVRDRFFKETFDELSDFDNIRLVDLAIPFKQGICDGGLQLRFKTDGHWNTNGHRVAADAIVQAIKG
jgi:hypothetical protein